MRQFGSFAKGNQECLRRQRSVFMDRVRDATGIHRLLSSPYGAWVTEGPLMLATVQNGGAGRLHLGGTGLRTPSVHMDSRGSGFEVWRRRSVGGGNQPLFQLNRRSIQITSCRVKDAPKFAAVPIGQDEARLCNRRRTDHSGCLPVRGQRRSGCGSHLFRTFYRKKSITKGISGPRNDARPRGRPCCKSFSVNRL